VADDRVHLHVDLIWGLPGETLADIRASFEQAIALGPHELQLGLLKFLPGAPIRSLIESHGYVYQDGPPYEVIAHRDLSAEELLALKRFEAVFELYFNSGRFRFTLRRLMQARGAWAVFEALAAHFAAEGLLVPSHGLEALLAELQACARGWIAEAELTDLLKLDYFYHHAAHAGRVPAAINRHDTVAPPAVRAYRKAHPGRALVAFHHRIAVQGGSAELEPSAEPVWYVFAYPRGDSGYFFRPTLQALE
jgi:Protein of unknown function (DUF4080)